MAIRDEWVDHLSAPGRTAAVHRADQAKQSPIAGPTSKPSGSARGGKPGGNGSGGGGGGGGDWPSGKTVKLLLLGDSAVGKTSVLTRYSDGLFVSSTRPTLGADLRQSQVDLDGTGACILPLQIWDTAGQEMFRSIIASYYRGAHGVLLMFDLTRRSTFDNLTSWMAEVEDKAPEQLPLVLVGNKSDQPGREVGDDEAQSFAAQHGMQYVETSAKAGHGVNEAFVTLVATSVGRVEEVQSLLETARITHAPANAPMSRGDAGSKVGVIALNGGGKVPRKRSSGCC